MNFILHYSPQSLNDLDEIHEYIQTELSNPSAAIRIVNDIMDAVEKLQDYPNMGTRLSSVSNIQSDYRFLISNNYMVFYRHLGNDVYIDRILYARRNYLRILFEEHLI